ncbi:MAG: Ig-like domain-containing protein, partial [Cellulomonadaceae bacterium]
MASQRRDAARVRAAADGSGRRWTTMAAIAVVPALLAVLALVNPGVKVSQVDLNDGSVWLTNTSQRKLGRYNAQVKELNGGLVPAEQRFDVLQDGSDVLLTEPAAVSVVDPAAVTLATQVAVPAGSSTAMAAGVAAVTSASGEVWAAQVERMDTLVAQPENALFELGEGALSAVTRTGEVLSFDPATGQVHSARLTGDALETSVQDLGGAGIVPEQAAAVGDQLVVLAAGVLYGQGWSADLREYGSDLVLQQTSAAHEEVLVAGPSVLLRVPLGGGEPARVDTGGAGTPARPVFLDGCVYGAWASPLGSYYSACGDDEPTLAALEGMSTADRLVFRVNRSVIVLNDVLGGRIWLPEDVPQVQEPNWDQIESQEQEDTEENSEEVESTQNMLDQCAEDSTSPSAAADEIGVRAGRTTVLDVLGNDSSGECGIIAISEFDPLPEEFGTLQPIYGGRALQLQTAPGASGTVSFTYTITDGRGTSDPSTATVHLTVSPGTQNAAPEQLRESAAEVELRASVRMNVLADFIDPDGDDLQLLSGVSEGGATVRTRADGMLTFIADGERLGRQSVRVQVSDGQETTEGVVHIDVRPAGSLAPTIDTVHAVAHVDEQIDVDVLSRVRSGSREPVRLASVQPSDRGGEVVADYRAGTFSFQASRVGTYYVPFTVSAPPHQSSSLARIDVVAWPETQLPPVAVRDSALLPLGGEVTIDPLANDTDPGGGVLVLVSASAAEGSALQLATLNHRLLRITATRSLDGPEIVEYIVSNGVAQARGEIVVQPTSPSASQRAPVVQDVEVSVRTGGLVTVPVMDGAYDPDSDEMTLQPELVEQVDDGLLFVSGDVLRYQAPDTPTTAHAVFAISDSAGNVTAARLTVSVHASDAESKQPARPKDLTARVFEGETVRIQIPLVGIDDDGDGVSLLGQASAPAKGRVIGVGADYLEYEALP